MNYGSATWRNLFWSLPSSLQNTGAAIYGIRHNAKTFGKYYNQCYDFLQKSQWFSSEELENYQNEKTVNFLKYAVDTVPYYRRFFAEKGLTAKDIRRVDDLGLFSLLDKEAVRLNGAALVSDPFRNKKSQIVNAHTSGTTGKGLHLMLSREAFQREYAFRWLHFSWAGIVPGVRIAFFAGHPVARPTRMVPPFWIIDKWNKTIYFSSQHIAPVTLPAYIAQLKQFGAHVIRGYPSSVHTIASAILESGETSIRPRAVFTNSETLRDYQRAAIEKAFLCKVYDWYGNAEQVANIVECEEGRLHVKEEHSLIEFLKPDGSEARPGETGEMVCTGFGNPAMPLIRYRIGDLAVLSAESCDCKRGGRIVERIIGRMEDIVVTPEGRHVGRLDHLFKDMLNVKEAQIVQNEVDSVKIRIVKRPQFDDKDVRLLMEEARLRLGHRIKIDLEFVDEVKREPSGKVRFVISSVSPSIPGMIDTEISQDNKEQ